MTSRTHSAGDEHLDAAIRSVFDDVVVATDNAGNSAVIAATASTQTRRRFGADGSLLQPLRFCLSVLEGSCW